MKLGAILELISKYFSSHFTNFQCEIFLNDIHQEVTVIEKLKNTQDEKEYMIHSVKAMSTSKVNSLRSNE